MHFWLFSLHRVVVLLFFRLWSLQSASYMEDDINQGVLFFYTLGCLWKPTVKKTELLLEQLPHHKPSCPAITWWGGGSLLGTKNSSCAHFCGCWLRRSSAVVILVMQAASSAFPDRKGRSSVWCEKQKHLWRSVLSSFRINLRIAVMERCFRFSSIIAFNCEFIDKYLILSTQFHFDMKSPGTCGPNTEGKKKNRTKLNYSLFHSRYSHQCFQVPVVSLHSWGAAECPAVLWQGRLPLRCAAVQLFVLLKPLPAAILY